MPPLAHAVYIFITALCGAASGLVSLLLGAAYYGLPMFWAYFSSPLLILLNILPPVLVILLLYFSTGRAWISFLVTSAVFTALSLVNFFKLQLRNDPFVAADVPLAGEAGRILGRYSLTLNWKVFAAVAFVIAGTVLLAVFLRGGIRHNWVVRAAASLMVIALSAGLYVTVYTNDSLYNRLQSSYAINVWSEQQKYITRGFVYPFIHSIPDAVSVPPEGYSARKAEEILASYASDDIPDGKKVNVIAVMLEAYSDLSVYDIGVHEDVYAGLYGIYEESYHGTLVPNVFAAGTIDTERSFLTGYTGIRDHSRYRTDTNSYVWYLREQGYAAEGLHPGDSWFYNRQNVNGWLGFENYCFLEDFENGNRWDSFFFAELERMYEGRDASKPYFNFSVSYQNHGAYSSTQTMETSYLDRRDLSDESYNILNNYFSGIRDTSNRLKALTDRLREQDDPVVLVFFGDHKPWLGNANSVYTELGINLDLSTREGFYNYYSTPYVIWANDSAKSVLGNDFQGEGGYLSPCFLMNELFELCSWEGNSFMKLNDELKSRACVVSCATGMFEEDGALTYVLSDEAQEIYDKYVLASYRLRHDFTYGELR